MLLRIVQKASVVKDLPCHNVSHQEQHCHKNPFHKISHKVVRFQKRTTVEERIHEFKSYILNSFVLKSLGCRMKEERKVLLVSILMISRIFYGTLLLSYLQKNLHIFRLLRVTSTGHLLGTAYPQKRFHRNILNFQFFQVTHGYYLDLLKRLIFYYAYCARIQMCLQKEKKSGKYAKFKLSEQ